MMTELTASGSAQPTYPTSDHSDDPIIEPLSLFFGAEAFVLQATRTGMPVLWIKKEKLLDVMLWLKNNRSPM